MNRSLLFSLAGALAFSTIGLIPAASQDKTLLAPAGEKKEPDGGSDMKVEQHKVLAKLVGDFDTVFKVWPEAGKEATEVKSSSHRSSVLGGFFVREVYELAGGPSPHTGEITWGYDPTNEKLQLLYVTSVNPYLRVVETDWDGKSKTVEFKFSATMEWQGEKLNYNERCVFTIESEDRQKLELFTEFPGMKAPGSGKEIGEFKDVEVTYTRKKK